MTTDVCNEGFCREFQLLAPPPIPPKEYLPRTECREIISSCSFLSSHKGAWSNYSDPCLPPRISPAAVTEADAGIPGWLIGVIVVAVLAFIFIVTVIVICCIKKAKGESPERRADYVLSDYHRVNYLHNKMEKGEKYKRKKKTRQDQTEENTSNNNIENGLHVLELPQISAFHDSGQIHGASSPGYDELSKCYTRQSNEIESSFLSEQESNRPLSDGREWRVYTPTTIDADEESNACSDNQASRIYTPTVIDGEPELASSRCKQESPYAVSNVLPNVPVDYMDDHPPPAPHGMYANHQFEKLQGFPNRSYINDEDHKGKPLPPNPFPDLCAHTSIYSSNLFDNVGQEDGIYKKKKKPIPKKRQNKK